MSMSNESPKKKFARAAAKYTGIALMSVGMLAGADRTVRDLMHDTRGAEAVRKCFVQNAFEACTKRELATAYREADFQRRQSSLASFAMATMFVGLALSGVSGRRKPANAPRA